MIDSLFCNQKRPRRELLFCCYLDSETAFNSVDHKALWPWLKELNVPDIDCFKASTLGHTTQQTCPKAGQLKLSSRGAKNRATNRPPYCLGSFSMPYSWPSGQLEWGTVPSRASGPLPAVSRMI